MHLDKPEVRMVPSPSGDGSLLVAAGGGVFAFGDAPFPRSTGGTGVDDIVTLTPDAAPTVRGNPRAARPGHARHPGAGLGETVALTPQAVARRRGSRAQDVLRARSHEAMASSSMALWRLTRARSSASRTALLSLARMNDDTACASNS